MKMKEICKKTGLTERTVRLYTEKGLVHPVSEELNGRTYREYSFEDQKQLNLVASLRKLEFSLDEILKMLNSPELLPVLLTQYRNRLDQQQKHQEHILQAVSEIDFSQISSAAQFVSYLQIISEQSSLPKADIEPNYAKFEEIPEEEKQKAYRTFLQKQEKTDRRTRRLIIGSILFLLMAAILWISLSFHFYYRSCYQNVFDSTLFLTNYESWEPTSVSENDLGISELNHTEYIYNNNGGQIVRAGQQTITLYQPIGGGQELGYQKIYQNHVLKEIYMEDPLGEVKAYFSPSAWFGGGISYDPFLTYSIRTEKECEQMAQWLAEKNYDQIAKNGGTLIKTTSGTEFIQ